MEEKLASWWAGFADLSRALTKKQPLCPVGVSCIFCIETMTEVFPSEGRCREGVLHISGCVCWLRSLCGLCSIDRFLPAGEITSGYLVSPITITHQVRRLSSREVARLDKDNSTPWQFQGTQMNVEPSKEKISEFQRQMFSATQRRTHSAYWGFSSTTIPGFRFENFLWNTKPY